jgi:hypothetical protein
MMITADKPDIFDRGELDMVDPSCDSTATPFGLRLDIEVG